MHPAIPAASPDSEKTGRWIVPLLAGIAGVGVIWWLVHPARQEPPKPVAAKVEHAAPPAVVPPPPPPPVAKVEPPAPPPIAKVEPPPPPPVAKVEPQAAPAPTLPAQLSLRNDGGAITVSGAVHDETARRTIMDMLRAFFGADNTTALKG